jgi:hypothetical protein
MELEEGLDLLVLENGLDWMLALEKRQHIVGNGLARR